MTQWLLVHGGIARILVTDDVSDRLAWLLPGHVVISRPSNAERHMDHPTAWLGHLLGQVRTGVLTGMLDTFVNKLLKPIP